MGGFIKISVHFKAGLWHQTKVYFLIVVNLLLLYGSEFFKNMRTLLNFIHQHLPFVDETVHLMVFCHDKCLLTVEFEFSVN